MIRKRRGEVKSESLDYEVEGKGNWGQIFVTILMSLGGFRDGDTEINEQHPAGRFYKNET